VFEVEGKCFNTALKRQAKVVKTPHLGGVAIDAAVVDHTLKRATQLENLGSDHARQGFVEGRAQYIDPRIVFQHAIADLLHRVQLLGGWIRAA